MGEAGEPPRDRAPHAALGIPDPFRQIVDTVADYAIFLLDREGRVASWNLGAERITGYRPEEIIGRHFSIFYPPEEAAAGKCERALEVAASAGRFEEEGWRVRKDGSRFWASALITPLRDGAGALRGFSKVTRDTTERRKAEEALRASEERFRLFVAGVADYAIYMLDPSGRIVSWNPGAERIKGYRAEEVIGGHFSTFYPPEDVAEGKPARDLAMALARGRFEDEGWRVRKDGSRFFANLILTALFDDAGTLRGFSKVTRDLTARKRAEEQADDLRRERESRIAAEAAGRARTAFLSMMGHELRTPLTALRGYVSALRRRTGQGKPIDDESFARLQAQIDRLSKLVRDVVDATRAESGRELLLDLARFDLGEALREAVQFYQEGLAGGPAARHTVELEAPEGPLFLSGDRLRIEQVIANLLDNAIKYSPLGGRVVVTARAEGEEIVIGVADSGIGVPAEELARIADRYYRATNAPERNFPGLGLGLGLAICREIVVRHGGRLEIESELGRGTTVRVRLPYGEA